MVTCHLCSRVGSGTGSFPSASISLSDVLWYIFSFHSLPCQDPFFSPSEFSISQALYSMLASASSVPLEKIIYNSIFIELLLCARQYSETRCQIKAFLFSKLKSPKMLHVSSQEDTHLKSHKMHLFRDWLQGIAPSRQATTPW